MFSTFFPFDGACASLAWSPNGRFLAVREARRRTFFIYDVQKKMRLPWTLPQRPGSEVSEQVSCFAWSPKGTAFALGCSEHVFLVDLFGSLLRRITLPRYGTVLSLAWSPSGKEVAVTTYNGVCYLYSVTSYRTQEPHVLQLLAALGTEISVHGWLGTKATWPLLSNNRSLLTLDASQKRPLTADEEFEIGRFACAVSPCRRQVALASGNKPQVHLFHWRPRDQGLSKTHVYQPEPPLLSDYREPWGEGNSFVVWSQDGGTLASCFYPQYTHIYVWDARTGKTLCVLSAPNSEEQISALAWGPDHHLAWGGTGYFRISQILP